MKYLDTWEENNIGIDIAVLKNELTLMIGWQSYNKETRIWWCN